MRGTLLSFAPDDLVIKTPDGSIKMISRLETSGVELVGGDGGLITKPTLELMVNAEKAGNEMASHLPDRQPDMACGLFAAAQRKRHRGGPDLVDHAREPERRQLSQYATETRRR